MTHVTCRLTAKYRDQLLDPTLDNRVWASFTFTFSLVVTWLVLSGKAGGAYSYRTNRTDRERFSTRHWHPGGADVNVNMHANSGETADRQTDEQTASNESAPTAGWATTEANTNNSRLTEDNAGKSAITATDSGHHQPTINQFICQHC